MDFRIDLNSGVPIYTQIVDRVKHMIATGELKPGDQLPTVRQLALDLRVNLNTVARAYMILNEAGIISTQQGRGTYVRDRPDERAISRLRADKLHGLIQRAVVEAFSLGYKPGEIRASFDDAIKHMEKESKR